MSIGTKRCFVSIDLPPSIKEYLASLQKPGIYWIKWLKPQNMHITLNFLGDIDEREIANARLILSEVAGNHQAFLLELNQIKQERDMLWIMPSQSGEIDAIQDELKHRLKHSRLDKRERRSFQPHVLLAKSKTGRYMKWRPENFRPVGFEVDGLQLYESELTPGSATHRLIQSFALNGPKKLMI